jgi:hypothetical protein
MPGTEPVKILWSVYYLDGLRQFRQNGTFTQAMIIVIDCVNYCDYPLGSCPGRSLSTKNTPLSGHWQTPHGMCHRDL